jgi:hypothetical protein
MSAKILHIGGDSIQETVYLKHDNSFSIILTDDTGAIATAGIVTLSLSMEGTIITSTNTTGDPIRWNQTGYAVGEIKFMLGNEDITAGHYPNCYIVTYDATNTKGIVWAALDLYVLDDMVAVTT